jgi:hypothetical protein
VLPELEDSRRGSQACQKKNGRLAAFTFLALVLALLALLASIRPAEAQAVDNFNIMEPAVATTIIYASTYGVSTANPDNSAQLQRAINACPDDKCKVIVGPGTYRMSGANSVLFSVMRDFEFDGGGATFLFRRESIVNQATGQSPSLFYIFRCTRCRWTNFVVDWDWSRWALASTVSVVSATSTEWQFRFVDETAVNTSTIFDYEVLSQLDPATGSMGVRNGKEFFIQGSLTSATQIFPSNARLGTLANVAVQSSNVIALRFANAMSRIPAIGELYLLRHLVYEIHGFYGRGCVHCTFTSITFRGVPGKCWTLGDDTSFLYFRGIKVVRQPRATPAASGATLYPVSSTADGIFISKTTGFIKIEDYEFSWGGDDAINIHNPTSSKGFTVLDSKTIRVPNSPNWRITYRAKDEIHFVNSDFTPTYFYARVVTASWDGGSTWTLALNRDLPVRLTRAASTLMISQNRYRASNVVIRGANLHHHRARGMLIQSSSTLVRDSVFSHINMACMAIRASAWWSEGTGAQYVSVINNDFERCDKLGTGQDRGAIKVDGQMTNAAFGATWRLHSDIEIKDNRFVNVPGRLWDISSGRRIAVTGNTIRTGPVSLAEVPIEPSSGETFPRGRARVWMAKDVLITGNTWIVRDLAGNPWTDPVSVDSETTTNVVTSGNQVLQQGARRMLVGQTTLEIDEDI